MYTAAVLRQTSALLLKWIAKSLAQPEEFGFRFETPQGEPLPHHMTMNLGAIDHALNSPECVGRPAEVQIDQIYVNHTLGVVAARVVAARVELVDQVGPGTYWKELRSKNKCPHITVALKPGVPAKTSNQVLETPSPHNIVVDLDQVYTLEAVVEEV